MPRLARRELVATLFIFAVVLAATLLVRAPLLWPALAVESAALGLLLWTFVPAFDPMGHDRHALVRESDVALTFDDGPDPLVTPRLLEALSAGGARATFFVSTERAALHPELVRAIASAGHEVGCHGFTHHPIGWRRRAAVEGDLRRTCELLQTLTGRPPRVFRAPYGVRGPWLPGALKRHHLRSIAWTLAICGRATSTQDALAERVLSRVRGGDVVALRGERTAPRGASAIADALPMILRGLSARRLDTVALTPDQPMRGSRLGAAVRVVLGLAISAIAVRGIAQQLTGADLATAIAHVRAGWLVLAAVLVLCTLAVRSRQVAPLIDADGAIGAKSLLLVTLGGAALNNVLPLHGGEVARTAWLSKLGRRSLGYTARRVVAEKVIEATALLFIAGLTTEAPWSGLALTLGVGVLVAVALGARPFLPTALWAILRWIFEIGVLTAALRSIGVRISPLEGALALVGVNLAIAIPSAPANIGVLEAGLMLVLGRFEIDRELAAMGAVLYHLADLLPTTLVGLAATFFLQRRGSPERPTAPPREIRLASRLGPSAGEPRRGAGARELDVREASILVRALARLGPDLAIFAAMLLALAVLAACGGATLARLPSRSAWLIPSGVVAFVALAGVLRAAPLVLHAPSRGAIRHAAGHVAQVVRDWLPLPLLAVVYLELGAFDLGRPRVGATLHALDLRLFGVEPSLWARHLYQPVLTDVLAIVYGTYFAFPLATGLTLFALGDRARFRELGCALLVVMYTGFVLYCLFPAPPPREVLTYPLPLPSAFGLNDRVNLLLDGLNSVPSRSSFPSLHCAMSTVALISALRARSHGRAGRALVATITPLVFALYVATIYLRHHWAVDVVVGIALGASGYAAAAALVARWPTIDGGPRDRGRS